MNSTFSYQLRILLCMNCGAPIEMPRAGGQAACRYCNAVNQRAMRDERPIFTPGPQTPLREDERVARLRAQEGKPLMPPPILAPLIVNGELAPWKVQEGFSIWQGTRQELTVSASYEAAERLLFLTITLSNHLVQQNDDLRLRAMLESALDAFTLPRHRQIMLGYLSRNACRQGDIEAAEQWLAACDPRSDDLETDSAYRFSRAFLDTARGNVNAVYTVLGGRHNDVPLQEALGVACAVLRANAWEKAGNVPAAVDLLQRAMQGFGPSGRQAMRNFAAVNPRLALCAHSLPAADTLHAMAAGEAAARAAGGDLYKAFLAIGVLAAIASVTCFGISITSLFVDLGPETGRLAGIALFPLVPVALAFGGFGMIMKESAAAAQR